MATEDLVQLRKVFVDLLKERDENGRKLTQEALADRLNADRVPSFSGNPWSKYAVRRMLKRLNLQAPNARRSKNVEAAAAVMAQAVAEQGGTADLSDTSPLRQWGYYESIRGLFEELTSEPYTEKGLADELNQRGITTVDKKAWDQKSVTRALSALQSSANASPALLALDTLPSGGAPSDDQVRERIEAGYYDTDRFRYVAVARKGPKLKKQAAAAPEAAEDKGEKKGKKEKEGKKKKGKKKK